MVPKLRELAFDIYMGGGGEELANKSLLPMFCRKKEFVSYQCFIKSHIKWLYFGMPGKNWFSGNLLPTTPPPPDIKWPLPKLKTVSVANLP